MLRLVTIVPMCLAIGLSSCGTDAAKSTAPRADDGPLVANDDGQRVVARVDGVPVLESCVLTQARQLGIDRRTALEQCIDFELLAQVAHERGYHRDPEVREAGRRELVRRLLDSEIVAPMPSVEGTDHAILEAAYKRYRPKIYAPERRTVFHVFAPFPEKRERPGTEADRRALAFARELHAPLAGRTDLDVEEVYRVALDVADGRQLGPVNKADGTFKREIFKVYRDQPNLPRGFSHAVMDVPDVGMVTPPTRSDYGWHVVLVTDREMPKFASVEQSADYLFQAVRSENYWKYTGSLLSRAEVAVDEQALERIQRRQDALAEGETER